MKFEPADLVGAYQMLDLEHWARSVAQVVLPKTERPMDLRGHPFLRDIFHDFSNEIVLMKGAQLGLSTTAILRAFWMLTTFPCTVIYTMPSVGDVEQYTQSRINPIITRSAYLANRIIRVDSVKQKQFAVAPGMAGAQLGQRRDLPRSTVYFRGSLGDKDAITVDADLLVHDEEDLSNPHVIEQFESRLDASRFKWKFRLSTPRLPGAGIDRIFKRTDQRRWFVRCSGCNAEFELAFPGGPWDYSNIEPETWAEYARGKKARYVCHRCGKTITDADRLDGRWIVTDPGQGKTHGYTISQMAAVWIPAERVLERKAKSSWEQDFWNLVMGIPWETGASVLTREGVLARASEDPMAVNGDGNTMGVDVGSTFDVVIGKGQRTVRIDRVKTYAELDSLMDRFHVSTCVIDALPEEHATRAWADNYNDYGSSSGPRIRVWRCFYSTAARGEVSWQAKTGVVTAPRTEVLSHSADELLTSRILPKFDGSPAYEAYVAHHFNSKRVPRFVEGLESEKVVERYDWVEVGPDHLFHAATYEMLARLSPRGAAMPPMLGMVSLSRGRDSSRETTPSVRPTSIRPPTRA